MGLLDTLKAKLGGAAGGSADKISGGLDKAGDFIDDKTGGKYSDKIDQGVAKAKDVVDSLDGDKDDAAAPKADTPPAPGVTKPEAATPPKPDAK